MQMIAVENELSKLDSVRSAWLRNRQLMQMKLQSYRQQRLSLEEQITELREALRIRDENTNDDFSMQVLGKLYTKRKEAGAALNRAFLQHARNAETIGTYAGFTLRAQLIGSLQDPIEMNIRLEYGAEKSLRAKVGESGLGTVQSIEAVLRGLDTTIARLEKMAAQHRADIEAIEVGQGQSWEQADRYTRLKEDLVVLKQRVLRDEEKDEEPAPVLSAQAESVEQAQAESPHIIRPQDGELVIEHILQAVRAAELAAFPLAERDAIPLDAETVQILEQEAASATALAAFSRAALSGSEQQVSFADWLNTHTGSVKPKRKEVKVAQSLEAAQLSLL